jgi:hypothetical protein
MSPLPTIALGPRPVTVPSLLDLHPSRMQLSGGGLPDLRAGYVGALLTAWTGLRRLDLVGKSDMVRQIIGSVDP